MPYLFALASVLLALTFAVGPVLYDPAVFLTFDLPKVTALQVGIELAALVWIFGRLADGFRGGWMGQGMIRKLIHPVWVAFALFLLINLLAALLAHLPSQAWWGNYYRRQGLWMLLHYALLFMMVADMVRYPRLRWLILHGVLLGAAANGVITLLEYYGIPDYAAWKNAGSYAGRLVSPFGQPNVAAEYQGMILPMWIGMLVMSLKLKVQSLKQKVIAGVAWGYYALGLTLGLFVILGSLSRGAWVAGGVTAGLVLLGWGMHRLRQFIHRPQISSPALETAGEEDSVKRGSAWRVILASCLVLLTLGGIGFRLVQSSPDLGWRLRQLVDPADWPNIERYQIWRRAWDLTLDRPILGYGQDNLELVFPAILRPTDTHLQQIYVDRAHNGYLETLVNTGWLGLLIYLLLIGLILLRSWRSPDSSLPRDLKLALSAGVVFYLIRSAFNIDGGYLDGLLWVYLAMLVGLSPKVESLKVENDSTSVRSPRIFFRFVGASLMSLIALLLCCYGLWHNYRLYEADRVYKLGLRWELVGEVEALPYYEEAAGLAPAVGLYRIKYADAAIQYGYQKATAAERQSLRRALELLLEAEGRGTESADYYYRLGQVYEYGGEGVDPDFTAQADHYYDLAHRWAPYKYAERN